jgi:hypothetical protein
MKSQTWLLSTRARTLAVLRLSVGNPRVLEFIIRITEIYQQVCGL